MVKKQNNNAWLVYVIALIAIVALVLAIVAMNKASMTGNAFWDFLRTKEVVAEQTQTNIEEYNGFLVGEYVEEYPNLLKGYQAMYDENGMLIYEILDNEIWPGNDYGLIEGSESFSFQSKLNGDIFEIPFPTDAPPGPKTCKCTEAKEGKEKNDGDCVNMGFPFGCVPRDGKDCKTCKKGSASGGGSSA